MPKADAAEKTQDVLGMMTASVVGRKTKAAAALTPVGKEVVSTHVLPATTAPFPNDVPAEAITQAVAAIRREVGYILAALDAVDEQLGKAADSAPVDLDAARKAREREADERVTTPETEAIKARIAEVTQKAKDDTFDVGPGETVIVETSAVLDGWGCPTHSKVTTKRTSAGREFRGCPDCEEFERL